MVQNECNIVNPVTCLFHFSEVLNDAFEVQVFQGFIFYTLSFLSENIVKIKQCL